ncbi:Gfo/Idh/MocA family oxidoreductase [uncultured Gimesia sp.]|uniref:Gfo/Idh/MocA family oxidoreductase n=1 Tax=uncultured Gimesia sp. TaxID=1678688 RepID=UPI002604B743|nr:Gfo/Idh/MocA family oxidoreductase [uncultured Gimesia sp.]
MKNFALMGAAGFVAPRHLQAIKETGNSLIAAIDPHDSVGILDQYFPETKFFTEVERFDRFLEKLRREDTNERVRYVSICTPNYLHDAHVRLAMRIHADAICEKPLVISPKNLDALAELEQEYGQRIYTVMQLRYHPKIVELKSQLETPPSCDIVEIDLNYISYRGPWYHRSWKGSESHSGGLIMNIGIHFFDVLIWLFGSIQNVEVYKRESQKVLGVLYLERAKVRWFLSIDRDDLPPDVRKNGHSSYRSMTIDGEEIDFSNSFTDLHTKTYEEILNGRGFGIEDARSAIELADTIRTCPVKAAPTLIQPHFNRKNRRAIDDLFYS